MWQASLLFLCFQRSQLPLQQIVAGIEPLFLKLITLLLDTKQLINQSCSTPAHGVLATFYDSQIKGHIRLAHLAGFGVSLFSRKVSETFCRTQRCLRFPEWWCGT